MAARLPNMMNLITWPLRSEIWLFVPFSLLSLIAFLLESDIDQYEYNESEDGAFQNISISDDSLVEILPTALEFKLIFIFAIVVLFGILFAVAKAAQFIFFGKLTETERTKLSEFFFRFVLLRIVILSGVINVTRFISVYSWIAWFSVLGLLHACSIVVTSRCNQLSVSSIVGKTEWIRSLGSVVFLTTASALLFKIGLMGSLVLSDSQNLDKLQAVTQQGIISAFRTTTLGVLRAKFTGRKDLIYDTLGVEVFIAAECLLLFFSIFHVIAKLVIEIYDRRMVNIGQSWPAHASFAYYADLLYMLFSRSIEVAHYTHLLLWSRLFSVASLIVFLHIRFAFASLVHHIHRYITYIRLLNYIKDNFQVFSTAGMQSKRRHVDGSGLEKDTDGQDRDAGQADRPVVDMCAICWEEMHVWRRLPCKHDFHENCLRSWLEQHPTCPTCRRDLGMPSSTVVGEVNRNAVDGQAIDLTRLFLRVVTRPPEARAAHAAATGPGAGAGRQVELGHRAVPGRGGAGRRGSFYLPRRLWSRAFGSQEAADSSASTSSSSSSQQEPLEDRAGSVSPSPADGNQIRRVPSSNRRPFNDSYFPWINAEFSELLRQMLTTNQQSASENAAAAASLMVDDDSTDDLVASSTSSSSYPANHELIYLPQRLRAPALEISSMLPQFPLSLIVADLLQTGQPDRTVENLLARPPPSTSSSTTRFAEQGSETRPLEEQQHDQTQRPDSQAEDNGDSESVGGGTNRSSRIRRILGRAGRRFFTANSDL